MQPTDVFGTAWGMTENWVTLLMIGKVVFWILAFIIAFRWVAAFEKIAEAALTAASKYRDKSD